MSLLFVVLASVGYLTLTHHYAIEAKVWHWKHGYSYTIADYEIAVPKHWLVRNQDSNSFTMVNLSPTRPPRDGKLHTTAVVSAHLRKNVPNAEWMDLWLSFQHKRLADEKVESIHEDTLKFNEESITCVGGKELSAIQRDRFTNLPQTDVVSLSCMSDRGLELRFVGEPYDIQPFYTLLSQIRRKS